MTGSSDETGANSAPAADFQTHHGPNERNTFTIMHSSRGTTVHCADGGCTWRIPVDGAPYSNRFGGPEALIVAWRDHVDSIRQEMGEDWTDLARRRGHAPL
jgi:hypothetical protein